MAYSLNPNRRGGGFFQNPSGGYRDSRSRERYPRAGARDIDFRTQSSGREDSLTGNRFLTLSEVSVSRSPSPSLDGKGKKRSAAELKEGNYIAGSNLTFKNLLQKHESFVKEADEINEMIGEMVSQGPPENKEAAKTREILGKIGSWIARVSQAGVESFMILEKASTYHQGNNQGKQQVISPDKPSKRSKTDEKGTYASVLSNEVTVNRKIPGLPPPNRGKKNTYNNTQSSSALHSRANSPAGSRVEHSTDDEGWKTEHNGKKGKKSLFNPMLNSACSLTVRGINFGYAFTSYDSKLKRIREAIYEEVERNNVINGVPEALIENNQNHTRELMNDIADIKMLGPLTVPNSGGKGTSPPQSKGNYKGDDRAYNFATVPVKITFTDVNVRIFHEKFLRLNTDFKISAYWHPKTREFKSEVEKKYESTNDIIYGFRPSGTDFIKVTCKKINLPSSERGAPWEAVGFYCCVTKNTFDHIPKKADRDNFSKTATGANTPVITLDDHTDIEMSEANLGGVRERAASFNNKVNEQLTSLQKERAASSKKEVKKDPNTGSCSNGNIKSPSKSTSRSPKKGNQ